MSRQDDAETDACMQEQAKALLKREAALERAQKEHQEQLQTGQVELARLEHASREVNRQLQEAEADYLTGTERLTELHREVGRETGSAGL